MLSLLFVTSHKFEEKSDLLMKLLTYLLVNVVLAEIRGFKLVTG